MTKATSPATYMKRGKGWRMSYDVGDFTCDLSEATEGLENEL